MTRPDRGDPQATPQFVGGPYDGVESERDPSALQVGKEYIFLVADPIHGEPPLYDSSMALGGGGYFVYRWDGNNFSFVRKQVNPF